MKCLIFFASLALLWAGTSFAELAVDKNVDGGNAEIVSIDGNTITFRPELHDTKGWWSTGVSTSSVRAAKP